MAGVLERPLLEMPYAVLDVETTGLSAGLDRIVEIAVARVEPDKDPQIVLDTLINPERLVSATWIHGITDDDVADAPTFPEIVPLLLRALEGCVVSAYNIYFDARFLEFELSRAGVLNSPPQLCLMYLRPLLGLGRACSLGEACRFHGIPYRPLHTSAADTLAASLLLKAYQLEFADQNLYTFEDLARGKRYKFLRTLEHEPLTSFDGSSTHTLSALLKPRER